MRARRTTLRRLDPTGSNASMMASMLAICACRITTPGCCISLLSIGALRWAAQRGARRCYLQVVDENASAMTLYGGLGFEVHHDYEHHVRDEATAAPK